MQERKAKYYKYMSHFHYKEKHYFFEKTSKMEN